MTTELRRLARNRLAVCVTATALSMAVGEALVWASITVLENADDECNNIVFVEDREWEYILCVVQFCFVLQRADKSDCEIIEIDTIQNSTDGGKQVFHQNTNRKMEESHLENEMRHFIPHSNESFP